MEKHITLEFPGGKKVDALIDGFRVCTDQALEDGGEGTAAAPFDHFFVSLATCTGITAYAYCQKHKIPTDGIAFSLRSGWDETERRFSRISMELKLPDNFPEEHRAGIEKRANACVVKKHILNPPEFELSIVD